MRRKLESPGRRRSIGRSPLVPITRGDADNEVATPVPPPSLPKTLSASIVSAGMRQDKGLNKGQWRRSIGGTPVRSEGRAGGAGARAVEPHPMQHALSQVVERMQHAHGSDDSGSEWGDND